MEIKSTKKLTTIALATMLVAMAVAIPLAIDEEEEVDAANWGEVILFAGGLAITGFQMGFMAGFGLWVHSLGGGNGGDPDAVKKALRDAEAKHTTHTLDVVSNLVNTVIPADVELIPFTSNYFERAIEYAAAEYWSLNATMDPTLLLDKTGIHNNYSNYLYSWSVAIENAYGGAPAASTNWTSSKSLDTMTLTLSWQGNSLSGGSPATNTSKIWMDVTQITKPTSSNNVVYIDTDDPINTFTGTDYSKYYTMYVFGGGSATTITNLKTGDTYTLNQGENNLKGSIMNNSTGVAGELPSGYYSLSAGQTYAGPMLETGAGNSADVTGGMVFGQGSVTYYALPNSQSSVTIYNSNGAGAVNSSYLRWTVDYTGPSGNMSQTSDMIGTTNGQSYNTIKAYDDLIQAINSVSNRTMNAANVIWGIFNTAEQSSMYISPSSITTNIPGHQMSIVESQAVFIQALRQIAQYQVEGKDRFDNWELVTNVESLDLYVYADVYLNGSLLIPNVIITPYITTTTQKLVSGQDNPWSGNGFAMVWAQVDNYSAWDGSTSISDYKLLDLSTANSLKIKKIVKDGQSISNIELTLYSIQKHNQGGEDPPVPPDPPKIVSINLLVTIMMLELAAIVALLWWKFPKTSPWILVIAAVIAIVGIVFPGTIAGLIF